MTMWCITVSPLAAVLVICLRYVGGRTRLMWVARIVCDNQGLIQGRVFLIIICSVQSLCASVLVNI